VDHFVRLTVVSDDAIGRQTNAARRRKTSIAPVSELIAVAAKRNEWLRHQTIGNDDIQCPRIVNIYNKDEWSRLRKTVDKFEAGSNLQEVTLICGAKNPRTGRCCGWKNDANSRRVCPVLQMKTVQY
jgi:hypothetical protein